MGGWWPRTMAEVVRVRFAPSPTGELHLGNVRTALFNWLFARHYDGQFILRIEDTDVARSSEEAERSILEGLRWLSLNWDEGPGKGGDAGPYHQSHRVDIYRSHVEELLSRGQAYRCYCSPERLEAMRAEQRRRGQPPGYDGRCRHLTSDQERQYRDQGIEPVIRFRTPDEGHTLVHDLLRGEISFANDSLEDFIILKSDGYPTYHLANVVDDHLMGVTDVLRADEWIPSSPLHLLLFQAFGWDPPRYIHLPLILDEGGGKLSKRLGDTSLATFRQRGYLPEAIVNYLALLGWSPGDTKELLTVEELTSRFTWERISTSPSVFDLDRLNWFNRWYIRHLPVDRIVREATTFLTEAYGEADRSSGTAYSAEEWLELLVDSVREEVHSLSEIPAHVGFAFLGGMSFTGESREALSGPAASDVLKTFIEKLKPVEVLDVPQASSILTELRTALKEEAGLGAREVMFPLRASLTGNLHGPNLAAIVALLGKERCIQRAESSRASFSS
jgi:nondiscriminating glutamyl-tRNA synthetase